MPIGEALAKDATLLFMSLNNAGRAGVAAIAARDGADGGGRQGAAGRRRDAAAGGGPQARHELLAGRHLGKIVLLP